MTAPQRPRGAFWGRFWRTLIGAPAPAATCRPVSVLGADGEPVHTRVLGDAPMSDESREAFGEIVRAAQRRHVAELRAEREAADDDVRAVAALRAALAAGGRGWGEADALIARFADRITALDARDAKARARTPIQGSGYTPLQLLGVVKDNEEPTR